MDDAPTEMDAEGAEEVDEGTQKIVEEDLCGFAALVMLPLDQTVLYTTHRAGPLAANISAGPVIDVSALCALEDWPRGPFVHEEEEFLALTPSKFPVIPTRPGNQMLVCEGQMGGMAVVEDTVDPARRPSLAMGCGRHPPAGR